MSNIIQFEDTKINYYIRLWNQQKIKYHQNVFFTSLIDKMKSKKRLTINQWNQLEFLLKNGCSMYESGKLPKNY